jgi:hypothetical protein
MRVMVDEMCRTGCIKWDYGNSRHPEKRSRLGSLDVSCCRQPVLDGL